MPKSPGPQSAVKEGSITGIILAGGESRRMGGVTKALLPFAGTTIIERVAGALKQVFSRVIVIANSPDLYGFLNLPIFPDIRRGCGSLGGLHAGLNHCRGGYGFLVACDMPFLDSRAIRLLAARIDDHDVVVPRIRGHLEPLHAVYSVRCIPYIESLLDQGDLKIINLFPELNVLEVPETDLRVFHEDLRFVMNLNTLEELEEARRLSLMDYPHPADAP